MDKQVVRIVIFDKLLLYQLISIRNGQVFCAFSNMYISYEGPSSKEICPIGGGGNANCRVEVGKESSSETWHFGRAKGGPGTIGRQYP